MKLIVYPPQGRWQNEKRYIVTCVFRDLLGLPEPILEEPRSAYWEFESEHGSLRLPNLFFPESQPDRYLTEASLPASSKEYRKEKIPVFWAATDSPGPREVDWLGSIFFLITRYEEAVGNTGQRDLHERFPASRSTLGRMKLLHRPIADEYAAELWNELRDVLPQGVQRRQSYRLLLSHDIDVPTQWDKAGPALLLKRLGGDLLKRRSVSRALHRLRTYFDAAQDEFFCFDWIMDQSEKRGLRSSFYFVAGGDHEYDPGYRITDPLIRDLIASIRKRGHEIGIHGSYLSATDGARFKGELRALEDVTGVPVEGGRQHYLRFSVPNTWRVWEEAGMRYDSSLGFAEEAGFRCGTCHEYQVFDLEQGEALRLRERPLIVMEHTLLSAHYEGLSHEQCLERVRALSLQVKKHSGQLTLLWHNHNLATEENRRLYLSAIQECL